MLRETCLHNGRSNNDLKVLCQDSSSQFLLWNQFIAFEPLKKWLLVKKKKKVIKKHQHFTGLELITVYVRGWGWIYHDQRLT